MKNLKLKYSDHYDWLYPVPGDWHLMKTAAEVSGFKIFASKCGHKGDINQWQDLHNILTACYEALFRQAIEEFLRRTRRKIPKHFGNGWKNYVEVNITKFVGFGHRC